MADKNKPAGNTGSAVRSLQFRLLMLILVTVLPLNALVIALSGWRLSSVVSEQRALKENEFALTMSALSEGIVYITEELDRFVLEYQRELTTAEEEDAIRDLQMVSRLQEVLARTSLRGNVSLTDRRNGNCYILFSEGLYDAAQTERIRIAVEGTDSVTTHGWVLRLIGGRYYYLRNYQFNNDTVSFRIDIQDFCSRMLIPALTEEAVYFSDGRDLLEITPEGSGRRLLSKEMLSLREKDSFLWQDRETGASMRLHSELKVPGMQNYMVIAFLAIVSLVLFLSGSLWVFLYLTVLRPLRKLQDAMHEIEKGRMDFRITDERRRETTEFIYVFESFNRMADEVEASHEKDMKMVQAELDNLRLQVNPHMLLNSFNTIFSLAQSKNTALIQDFSLYLVDYFRYVLRETADLVPLEKEMAFVESYTGIQKIRFPNRFTSVTNITEEAKKALVPPLLIENFVENAMKYALVPGKTIEVLVNARVENDRLLVSVIDTGKGFREEVLESIRAGEAYIDQTGHRHIGIWNCRRRMEAFYGDSAVMNITSAEGSGTQIFLDLPFVNATEQEAVS